MSPEIAGIVGIVLLFFLMFFRMYIGMAMALVGFLGFSYLSGFSIGLDLFGIVPYAIGSSYTLSVVPLFVLMGQFAYTSGLSQDIFRTVYKWLGPLPGGLAMAAIVGCAGFAAICGSSLATAATMGSVALPEMKKYRYDPSLATGSIAAGGTLGILIPPSIGFVIYGVLIEESIGKLLLAGILPGILLTLLYVLTIYVICKLKPERGPAGPRFTLKERLASLSGSWGMILLFILVMGGIYFGVFTPTEAAGVGAFGAFLITIFRGRMNLTKLIQCLLDSARITTMIFLIVIGANILTYFLSTSQLPMRLSEFLQTQHLNRYVILCAILLLYAILGCIMDGFSMIILTIPVLFPLIKAFGFDTIWFGVLMVIVLEMGLITPPVGLNVFIIKGVAGDIPMNVIFRGIWPFLIACVMAIILIIIFPQIATFIPYRMK